MSFSRTVGAGSYTHLDGYKRQGLLCAAEELIEHKEMILKENEKDLQSAREKGIRQSLLDRLKLDEKRLMDCLLYTSRCV